MHTVTQHTRDASRQPTHSDASRQLTHSDASRQLTHSDASRQLTHSDASRQLTHSDASRQLTHSAFFAKSDVGSLIFVVVLIVIFLNDFGQNFSR